MLNRSLFAEEFINLENNSPTKIDSDVNSIQRKEINNVSKIWFEKDWNSFVGKPYKDITNEEINYLLNISLLCMMNNIGKSNDTTFEIVIYKNKKISIEIDNSFSIEDIILAKRLHTKQSSNSTIEEVYKLNLNSVKDILKVITTNVDFSITELENYDKEGNVIKAHEDFWNTTCYLSRIHLKDKSEFVKLKSLGRSTPNLESVYSYSEEIMYLLENSVRVNKDKYQIIKDLEEYMTRSKISIYYYALAQNLIKEHWALTKEYNFIFSSEERIQYDTR